MAPAEAEPVTPLLELRDGVPDVVASRQGLAAAIADLASGQGPIGIDAERASGYKYSARAYLIQLRREGSTTWLIDPIPFDVLGGLDTLADLLADVEWILHAATQDLPCLRDAGLVPSQLFDTELAGRLLGYPKVGLATLVEELLGFRLKKEHSAVDWSTRPLPQGWLEYAALDVEVLVELRALLSEQLEETGKSTWAAEEFEALLSFEPAVRVDPWRRLSGLHRLRPRRAVAAARELWLERDRIAAERDVAPGRIVPDSALVAAAGAMPTTRGALMGTDGFHGRGARRYAPQWLEAIERARGLDEAELPTKALRGDGPPPPRAWSDRDPVAGRRLSHARARISEMGEELSVPVENLLTPDVLRRTLWRPPDADLGAVTERLRELGARPWQIGLVGEMLVEAIEAGEAPQEPESGSSD